ncbi:NUDIX hydrolase, partial [bacterium]|nr:NUDIX hydrolase [bacterium]
EVPAGVIDADEEPLAAAQRELREETGFMAGKLEPLYEAFPTPGFCTEYMYFFKASELEYSPLSPDVDEIIQPFEVAFSEALDMIRTGRITDLKSIAAIYALATEGYL